jgi:hypothetical protein
MCPGTGLDDVKKRKILPLPGLELRSLSRPVAIPALLLGVLSCPSYRGFYREISIVDHPTMTHAVYETCCITLLRRKVIFHSNHM